MILAERVVSESLQSMEVKVTEITVVDWDTQAVFTEEQLNGAGDKIEKIYYMLILEYISIHACQS